MKTFPLMMTAALLLAVACTPKTAAPPETASPAPPPLSGPIATDAGTSVTVVAASENVRETPNGELMGQLRKGDEVTVLKRAGNWVFFRSDMFDDAWVWAPALGYDYLNLYSPDFFLDSTGTRFRNVGWFQRLFSQPGERRDDGGATYQLFFTDIGLGSHETVVVEIAEGQSQIVKHGVTLYIDRTTNRIGKVWVDFFEPETGYQSALEKAGLPAVVPDEINSGHVIWKAGSLVPGVTVDLERTEWDSEAFSRIWYILQGGVTP